jgi:excisionase family DNA binding protein
MKELDGLPPTLTVPEAATVLRIGKNTLHRAIHRGEVKALHVGRRVLIARLTLEAMLGLQLSEEEADEEERAVRRFYDRRKLWTGQ